MEILAKSDGITLQQHTSDVVQEAEKILSRRPFAIEKYARFTGRDLGEVVRQSARWHDEGKKHAVWQHACRQDHATWLLNPAARGEKLMKCGIRHEMDSLVRATREKADLGRVGMVAIAAHHGKLGHRHEKRWSDDANFTPYWNELARLGGQLRWSDPTAFESAIRQRYLYDGPRALLQLADHRASAAEAKDELPELQHFNYEFPHKDKITGKPSYRGVQKIIEDLWDEPLSILRAPTGAGKTDAALIWAQHQLEKGRADRLVIAMPTRFTANQISVSSAANLSKVGLYHSSAWFKLQEEKNPERQWELKRFLEKEHGLARQLETPVTVTTLDHLCICLTGAREDHHAIFWGMANSCIVIDEADFYDEFTQYNLITLLRALKILEVPVLIMSATVPTSARKLYELSGQTIAKIHEDKSDLTRSRCRVFNGCSMARPNDIADLLKRTLKGEPTIIYANTVKRAQDYCDWFESQGFCAEGSEDGDPDKTFVLYHSRFTEPDKARKEKQLVEMLGADAWDKNTPSKPRGVAILTQIGELSVNISADLMISDLCPLDRLAQRAGRLARFGPQVGELHVIEPLQADKANDSNFYPAPYGEYIRGQGWQVSAPLAASKQWLHDGEFSAQSWIDGVNHIYPALQQPQSRTRENCKMLEKCLITNWLIVQAAVADDKDEKTKDWQSRDIEDQNTIYVQVENDAIYSGDSEPPFISWNRFREWEQSHGISARTYEIKKGVENGTVEERLIMINDDAEKIFVARNGCYNFARGLQLALPETTDDNDDIHDDD